MGEEKKIGQKRFKLKRFWVHEPGCDKKFSTHEIHKPYKCNICEKRFSFFRHNLKQHILVNHTDPANRSKVPCTECKKRFCEFSASQG